MLSDHEILLVKLLGTPWHGNYLGVLYLTGVFRIPELQSGNSKSGRISGVTKGGEIKDLLLLVKRVRFC